MTVINISNDNLGALKDRFRIFHIFTLFTYLKKPRKFLNKRETMGNKILPGVKCTIKLW